MNNTVDRTGGLIWRLGKRNYDKWREKQQFQLGEFVIKQEKYEKNRWFQKEELESIKERDIGK